MTTRSEVARSVRSYSITRGSIWSAIWLSHLRMSQSKDRTRESATYPCPGTNASERSMTAESSVIPCDLWTVIAQARRRGIWVIEALIFPFSSTGQSIVSAMIEVPSRSSTTGSHSNTHVTCPIEPFAYPASKLFFTNITRAHFLRTRVSGARHHFLRDSTSFSDHFEVIS